MRVLIVYASRYGQTGKVVSRIAEAVRSAGAEALVHEVSSLPANVAPHSCDVVVVAGSVYFGRHQRRLERFAKAQRENLAKVATAFVSVSGAAGFPEARGIAVDTANAFVARTGWTPDRIELVGGAEPYTRYGFLLKWFMVRFTKKVGRVVDPRRDYEFTDWEQVDRFARELTTHRRADAAVERVPRTPLA